MVLTYLFGRSRSSSEGRDFNTAKAAEVCFVCPGISKRKQDYTTFHDGLGCLASLWVSLLGDCCL